MWPVALALALQRQLLLTKPFTSWEHIEFLVTATIFWWPVIGPIEELRMAPLGAVVYVFGACGGAHRTCDSPNLRAARLVSGVPLQPVDTLHILPLIRDRWGLTPER